MKNIRKSRKSTAFSRRANLETLFWKHNYNCYGGTGSKSTGGFCVTRQGLLLPSKLGHILTEIPELLHYEAPMRTFLPYKGRFYCWTVISESGEISLTEEMMKFLHLKPQMQLLSIRSSDIAFTMGAKGPLWERAKHFDGEIPLF